ncbi:O-fucosyltransferase family protein [Gluconacetobacter sacchari]|uniref:Uncharacterized protein n=2 Tax=Gluconacetobacter sacchari TaxID=92759 RepID=A0A7W4NNW4_9PROT|nr:hypothetical protein [Gluconacetobacter sacchari]MBB2161276.1 hypothetical protein [Gluconacetobacter sacchari]
MSTPIGYSHCNLDLSNQKLALLGLVQTALDRGVHAIRLPALAPFVSGAPGNAGSPLAETCPFADYYDLDALKRFMRIFGLELIEDPETNTEEPYGSFMTGASAVGLSGARGLGALYGHVCQFFSHLIPSIRVAETLATFRKEVYDSLAIKTALHLCIDTDLSEEAGIVACETILRKVQSWPTLAETPIYVACEEQTLPVSKEKIRQMARNGYGLDLVWKSDLLTGQALAAWNSLDLSLLDFETALAASLFIGNSHSTFSNLVSFEKFCRDRTNIQNHAIHNGQEATLTQRRDNGVECDPILVATSLLQRLPLVPLGTHDCRWPAAIHAHVAGFGDMESTTAPVPGLAGGDLVVGSPRDDGRWICGIAIAIEEIAGIAIEYRVLDDTGQWSDWVANGAFAGYHSDHRALRGVAIRLAGPAALHYDCLYGATFAESDTCIMRANGEACQSPDQRAVTCLHVLFRPAFGACPRASRSMPTIL